MAVIRAAVMVMAVAAEVDPSIEAHAQLDEPRNEQSPSTVLDEGLLPPEAEEDEGPGEGEGTEDHVTHFQP